ncbi:hypothetical protein DKX38_013390 [Salix brachista]|uniref:Uncharacterized protein n=1 Tax=Salix brachista TaxID=2182728 RepID=A0A5N5LRN5_9ROSI|nr:hypothetical protein DKX38_013390 [Salix brachista]
MLLLIGGGVGRRILLSFKETPHGIALLLVPMFPAPTPRRSCIAANAEKLSVLDFEVEPQNGSLEGIILCFLLASGSVMYFRRKRTITRASGAGPESIQMNSRF